MNIEALRSVWEAFSHLLGEYYTLIVVAFVALIAFWSVRSYHNLRRLQEMIGEVSYMVSRIEYAVDQRMEEFTQNLLEGYRHIDDLKEKLLRVRGA